MTQLSLKRTLALLIGGSALALAATSTASAQIALVQGGVNYNLPVSTWRDVPFRTVVRQQYDYSCGSAALATLLHYHYGRPVTESEIFKAMYAVGDREKIQKVGFSLLDMKKYLDAQGLTADGYRANMKALEHLNVPAIAVVTVGQYRHFVVIKGAKDGKILVGDPALGLKVYTEDEFGKMWNGIVFAIHAKTGISAVYNRSEEWSPWPNAPVDAKLSDASLSSFTRELPPLYMISPEFRIDPYLPFQY